MALSLMKNTCYETFNRSAVVKGIFSYTTGFHPELFTLNRYAIENPTMTKCFNASLYPWANYFHIYIIPNRYSNYFY